MKWRDRPIAEASRGLCPYVSNKTRLAQRRRGAEEGKNGASDSTGLGTPPVQLTISAWDEVEHSPSASLRLCARKGFGVTRAGGLYSWSPGA